MEVHQQLELYPDYVVMVTMFDDVSNVPELREMLMKGQLKAALINATMVPDVLPILLAANKAVHMNVNGKLKTRNVYSEILFNLSPTNNISESLKMFGLTDTDSAVVIASIQKNHENNIAEIIPLINGSQIALSKLQSIADGNKIKKVYKIPDAELSCGSLSDAVVMRIATKDAS